MSLRHLSIATTVTLLAISGSGRAAIVLEEVRDDVVARAEIERDKVPLSGNIILTLTVEGPDRIEVAPPRPLLTKESAPSWLVRELGLPTVERLDKGKRNRWKLEFRLSPYEAGPRVVVALAPLKVKAGGAAEAQSITWMHDAAINVTTVAQADPQTLHAITDIEALPPAEPAPPHGSRRLLYLGAIGGIVVVLIVGLIIIARRRRERDVRPHHDAAWALREIAVLAGGGTAFTRLAEVLRLFVQHRSDVPATRLTTLELVANLRRGNHLASSDGNELLSILDRCDLAKFAEGISPGDVVDNVGPWAARAREFVERTSSAQAGAPAKSTPV